MKRSYPDDLVIGNLSRRGFLKGVGATGVLLVAANWGWRDALAAEKKAFGADAMPHGWVDNPKIYVSIDRDGTVGIVCNRSEMGQGVRTSLAMVVADELEADWSRVKVIQAPGDEARYGNQDTDGSRSMRHWFEPMRRCGAAARQMLEQAAANQWKVPLGECRAEQNKVLHAPSGRSLSFGELAEAAAGLEVPARDKLLLKKPEQFRYIGKDVARAIDGADIVNGRAGFGFDARFDDMLYAVVARPPVYGGKLKRYDAAAALKVPGVVKVIEIEGRPIPSEFQPLGGVAVVAQNTWAAIKGREALVVEWDAGVNGGYDSVAYRKQLEEAARKPGKVVRDSGDAAALFARGGDIVEAEYYLPHLAQAPMEPPVSTAWYKDGACEVWAPTQAPQVTRERIAERLKLPFDKVTVNVTLLGGGFGRKSKPDFVLEAAILAKAFPGRHLRVQWTREDDLHFSYFHTVSVERLQAVLGADGLPQAWLHRSVAPSITALFGPDSKHQGAFELGMGLTNLPFAIPNVRLENPEAPAHTRVGWFRSVSNIPPRLRHPELRRRTGGEGRPGPEGLPAQAARPGAADRHRRTRRQLELRRVAGALPTRCRPPARGDRGGGAPVRLGRRAAQGQGAGNRRALQLRHLRGGGDRGGGEGRRRAAGAQGHHRRRLRSADQPRAHPLAARRRLRDGPGPGGAGRDQLQGWQGPAGQLPPVRAGAHAAGAQGGVGASAQAGWRPAVGRGRRARRAADSAGAVQRDLRRHRQAHPRVADPQSVAGVAEGLGPSSWSSPA